MALERWKARSAALKSDTYALYLACRDPRVPWLPKLISALVVAYALSPIDLIPDFIPVVGYLDDLILVPLGLALAIRLIPAAVLEEHRAVAVQRLSEPHPRSWAGAVLVLTVWGLALGWLLTAAWRLLCG